MATPTLVDFSRASPLDLFEQPARGFFSGTGVEFCTAILAFSEFLIFRRRAQRNSSFAFSTARKVWQTTVNGFFNLSKSDEGYLR